MDSSADNNTDPLPSRDEADDAARSDRPRHDAVRSGGDAPRSEAEPSGGGAQRSRAVRSGGDAPRSEAKPSASLGSGAPAGGPHAGEPLSEGGLGQQPPAHMSDREVHAWNQTHTRDMWRIFRIMSEFVDGFDKLSRLGPCVSVFGSARTKPDHPYYKMGEQVGRYLVEREYGVITGGGPGIMEAANKGARDAGGMSIGLNIVVPHEQEGNPYVDRDKKINFNFFFVRKVMFVKYAMGFIVLPGGFGTMDELFESLTLIQTGKSTRFPVVLVGTDFWGGMVDWLQDSVLSAGNISPDDPNLFKLTDDPREAVEIIDAFYREHAMVPNF